MCGFGLTIILSSEKFFNFKIMIGWFTLLLCEFISLWFTRLTRCFVNARVRPGCTGSGYRLLWRDELEESRRMILLFRCVLYEDRLLSLSRCVLYSDIVNISKAFNKGYFCIIICSAAMWDSVLCCLFFFFYSNISILSILTL